MGIMGQQSRTVGTFRHQEPRPTVLATRPSRARIRIPFIDTDTQPSIYQIRTDKTAAKKYNERASQVNQTPRKFEYDSKN